MSEFHAIFMFLGTLFILLAALIAIVTLVFLAPYLA